MKSLLALLFACIIMLALFVFGAVWLISPGIYVEFANRWYRFLKLPHELDKNNYENNPQVRMAGIVILAIDTWMMYLTYKHLFH